MAISGGIERRASFPLTVADVIQLADICLGLSKKWIGPSQFSSSDLSSMAGRLCQFVAAMDGFRRHLDVWEHDQHRLESLEGLREVTLRCTEALRTIEELLQRRGLGRLAKHLVGPRLDKRINAALKHLDSAKELFTFAVLADQQGITLSAQRHLQKISADLVDLKLQISEDVTDLKATVLEGQKTLQDMDRRQLSQEERETRRAVLDWISTADHAADHADFVSRRQAGTGQWFLQSDSFRRWLEAETAETQTLICPGIPGAGKTIITAAVIEFLQAEYGGDPGVGISFAYCNYNKHASQRSADLLRSILRQLLQGRSASPIPDFVLDVYEKEQSSPQPKPPSIQDTKKMLREIVTTGVFSTCFIVVDALDEFQVNDRCDRETFLSELLDLGRLSEVRMLVTSRHTPELEEFEPCLNQEILARTDDVCAFLDGYMDHLPKCVRKGPSAPQLREEIKGAISGAVDGMFLLARVYADSLDDKLTPKAMRAALKQFQGQASSESTVDAKLALLTKTYEVAMERVNRQKDGYRTLACNALQWIVRATRPILMAELRQALAVEPDDEEFCEENTPEIDDVISACAGLVTVDEASGVVRLVHYTMQEYFDRTWREWFPGAEASIASACVTYLRFDSVADPRSRDPEDKFYDYAAWNWGDHSQRAEAEAAGSDVDVVVVANLDEFVNSTRHVHAALQNTIVDSSRWWVVHPDKGRNALHLAACAGVESQFDLLCERTRQPTLHPDSTDNSGWTPLCFAARFGHVGIVRRLLGMGAGGGGGGGGGVVVNANHKALDFPDDPDNKMFSSPLSFAVSGDGEGCDARHVEIVEVLLEHGADAEAQRLALLDLVGSKLHGSENWDYLLQIAGLLLKSGIPPVNTAVEKHWNPLLTTAAFTDRAALVELLLDHGADAATPRPDDGDKMSPLMGAAKWAGPAVMRALMARGADPFAVDRSNGLSPLRMLASRGRPALLDQAIAHARELGIIGQDDNKAQKEEQEIELLRRECQAAADSLPEVQSCVRCWTQASASEMNALGWCRLCRPE